MRLRIVAVPLVLGSFLGALASANPSFDVIAPLEGQSSSAALAVSADGCRVVGQSDDEALSWRDGVSSPIREYGWYPVAAQAVSPDGQSVGGTTGSSAFVLTPGWGLQSLPGSGGFSPTDLYQFGSDWTFAVGRADEGHGTESHPYFRSPSGTWILPGGRGEARALSADHHIAGVAGPRARRPSGISRATLRRKSSAGCRGTPGARSAASPRTARLRSGAAARRT